MNKALLSVFFFLFVCCQQKTNNENIISETSKQINAEQTFFNSDSAYAFIGSQVLFGPRVPNTKSHKDCAKYLTNKMKQFCDTVFVQNILLTAYNNELLEAKNIIGVFNPSNPKRILLFAHWDSRPFSDHDIDERNYYKAIDGADDGASGVGVLLEIARQVKIQRIEIGLDIIFFDAEDYGIPSFVDSKQPDTYCLGSQYWALHPHIPNYKAEFGILLDMVGSRGAKFYKELHSVRNAKSVVDQVWAIAQNKGFNNFFLNEYVGAITDDHIYVTRGRGIPCIDIINCDPKSSHGFGAYWHTQQDNMSIISHETLNVVGQTIMEVIFAFMK